MARTDTSREKGTLVIDFLSRSSFTGTILYKRRGSACGGVVETVYLLYIEDSDLRRLGIRASGSVCSIEADYELRDPELVRDSIIGVLLQGLDRVRILHGKRPADYGIKTVPVPPNVWIETKNLASMLARYRSSGGLAVVEPTGLAVPDGYRDARYTAGMKIYMKKRG